MVTQYAYKPHVTQEDIVRIPPRPPSIILDNKARRPLGFSALRVQLECRDNDTTSDGMQCKTLHFITAQTDQ